MRRKEKEIAERGRIDDIIQRAQVCRLAMIDDGDPYVVPLCFGYDGEALFFHSASEGRKIEALRRNNRVCFEIDTDIELTRGKRPCQWGMRYTSVIGFGHAVFVDDSDAKLRALELIMAQYDSGAHEFSAKEVARTTIIRVEIEQVSAKRAP